MDGNVKGPTIEKRWLDLVGVLVTTGPKTQISGSIEAIIIDPVDPRLK